MKVIFETWIPGCGGDILWVSYKYEEMMDKQVTYFWLDELYVRKEDLDMEDTGPRSKQIKQMF